MDDSGSPPLEPKGNPSQEPEKAAVPAVAIPHHHRKSVAVVLAILLVLIVILRFWSGPSFFVPKTNYVPVYRLVNEKISQHGAIVVNLPHGVGKTDADGKVAFEPELKGSWVESELKDAIVYKPSTELSLGKHYQVSLTTGDGVMKSDFLVDEDPAVVSVLPGADAEADPSSAITVIFNRPMVPLTTLSELESKNIPVSITPATEGRFKWITTRTLQFIPTTSLAGSAHYNVTVQPDFVSTDGLKVPGKTYTFATKALRLERTTTNMSGTIIYNQPIQFFFNQPIDIDKTSKEVRVTNTENRTPVQFVTKYGTKRVWNDASRAYKDVEDRSTLSVLPLNSLNGHSNVWDFDTTYTVDIQTAYAPGGDIPLSGSMGPAASVTVRTSNVMKNVSLTSDKTNLASVDLFDPEGTAVFSFYEDIDVGKSVISAKGLKKTEYGKKCADVAEDSYNSSNDCTKVDDKSVLIMHFEPTAYARGEKVTVSFQRLTNADGFQVNKGSLDTVLTVYPELRILRSTPSPKQSNASVKDLVLCTNVPLKAYTGKEFNQNFKANGYMVFGRWDSPYLEGTDSWEKPPPCDPGQFVNKIHYGLLPLQAYSLQGNVEDAFGQKASLTLSIRTEQAPKFYLRFQNLQKIYNVTTPAKTKLTFSTENFDYVDAYVCKVSPDTMVRYLATEPRDSTNDSEASLSCLSGVRKRIQMKSDQWVNQYFQLDLKDYFPDTRGQYVISFTHPQYKDERGMQLYARTYLSVTNLAVSANRVKWTSYDYAPEIPDLTPSDTRGSVYWVTRIGSLAAEAGARISIYQYTQAYRHDSPPILADTKTTNTDGITEFPLIADVAGASITSGDDSAVVSQWADTLSQGSWSSAYQEEKVYLYTDRPIYRPGQDVFLKGLYRLDFDGAFKIFRDKDVEVRISDSKGNSVLDQRVPVSAYGTFSATLKLPDDAPLGSYYVTVRNNSSSFDVEEYKGSAFETTASTEKDEYFAGDTANVAIAAKYYFGVPLDGGDLQYSITSQNFYFDRYTDDYFNFGGGWYDCYDCGYGDTYLKNGKISLDAGGTADIAIPLDFSTLFKGSAGDQSKIFVVHGTIKDKQGKSVSFQKSFIVHRADYYLGVKADPAFTAAKQPVTVRLKTVDTQGKPFAKSGLTVTVSKVSWESSKRQEVDGGFYDRPQRTLTEVTKKYLTTNYSGDASADISLDESGEYQLDASGKDGHGNEAKSSSYIYVYGPGTIDVRPTNNATLDMTVEKKDVKSGENAKFILQNPYQKAKALISIERGRIFTYQVLDINQSVYEYQFPITEEYAPNVFASVILLSPQPEVKFGQVEFNVDKKAKELSVDVKSDKESYLPGEKVSLTIATKDASGHAVPAEVSVAVADVSVLALKGNPKKDPLLFFYDGFPLAVTAETNIKNLLEETPIPTGTKGGDGGSPADLATKKRGEFKDTAFWKADVTTDASGVARVSFTLPDNLTKWQIESLGITKDTKLGVNYKELITQKDVMTIPLAPRFVVPGDEFMVGAKIFNQTAASQNLDISLSSQTLEIVDSPKTSKVLKAGDTATVYFKVKAPLKTVDGEHSFTLSAKNDGHEDTVETKIHITRNETYESTATAGSTPEASAKEYLYLPGNVLEDRGGLTIKTSATLAGYLTDALKYLFDYPYGCSEQLASKLSAIAIGKKALSVPNVSTAPLPSVTFDGKSYSAAEAVSIGLKQIYDNQTTDGGFAYYKGLQSNPYLTLAVLNSLMDVKQAGYSVRPEVISAASNYLYTQTLYAAGPNAPLRDSTDGLILAAYTLSRVDSSASGYAQLLGKVMSRASTSYLSDTSSSESLAYLAVIAARGGVSDGLKKNIYGALLNRVDVDSRGAYLKEKDGTVNWFYYETPEKDTALLLKALVADKHPYPETDNLIRWLLASRSKDGSWGSTNTTVAALDALADYLGWKRETESQFTLKTTLDGTEVISTTFDKKNILSTMEKFLPVAGIGKEKTHVISFDKTNANALPNTFYYDLSLKYYLPVINIAPRDEGFAVTREFYSLTDTKKQHPLSGAKVGEVLKGVVTIISPKERHLVAVEDYIPAGFELVNFDLATEDKTTETGDMGTTASGKTETVADAPHKTTAPQGFLAGLSQRFAAAIGATSETTDSGSEVVYEKLYPDFKELRDDRLFLFEEIMHPGAYSYEYYVRATTPGTFAHLPAVASELYFPENFGRTSGTEFTVGN